MDPKKHPLYALLVAALPIARKIHDDGGDYVTPPDETVLDTFDYGIRIFIETCGPNSSAQDAVRFYLDQAYSGKFEGVEPQLPRELVEKLASEVRTQLPELWAGAAAHYGLTP